MPELPEVEVLRLSLSRRLPGRRIERSRALSPTLREPLDASAFTRWTDGRLIESLGRRAKYLLIHLEGESTLVIHLGMSGRLTVVDGAEPRAPHEHVIWPLDDGSRLRLVDPRRFGLAYALPTAALDDDPHLVHLGVEPLDDAFSGAYLQSRAQGRRGPIKTFLMDGSIVVGVGNIYVAEALWRARVHPKRSVARVSAATWARVASAVREVLAEAIAQGGTTLNDFADGDGNAGYFQITLAAYGREDEPCARCARPIRRLVQSNRSTFYCPGCQR